MVILKHLFWPVKKPKFTCDFVQCLKRSSFVWLFLKDSFGQLKTAVHLWFRAVVKKEQFCVVILKHLFWPVKKPRFPCDFVQCLKRSSFVWLFLKDSFGQLINRCSLVVLCSG